MSADDEKYPVDNDLLTSTVHVDDNASATNNEVSSTENRASEEEYSGHHVHDLKVSSSTTLLGTDAQQQVEDSPRSYWQQTRLAQQSQAPPLNQQNHTIDVAHQTTLSGIRPLGLNEPSSLHQLLLGHLQLATNNSHNRPGFPFVPQVPSTQAPMPMPTQQAPPSLLEQIQQALTTQNLSGNPLVPQVPMMGGESDTQTIARALLLQHLSVPQNPSYFPTASHDQYQSKMSQIEEYIRIREQITALLLLQQQSSGTNAATQETAFPDFNSFISMIQGHRAMSMMSSQNPMQQGSPHTMAMASAAAAATAFNPAHASSLIGNNNMFDVSSLAVAAQPMTVAPQCHSADTPSHNAKEKRWLIRYEELQQFHMVRC